MRHAALEGELLRTSVLLGRRRFLRAMGVVAAAGLVPSGCAGVPPALAPPPSVTLDVLSPRTYAVFTAAASRIVGLRGAALITARTMAAQCHDVFARVMMLERWVAEKERKFVRDLADQFERVRSLADGESLFLFGVIELYQTKVHTKMTVAMERLAVIAAITLPITALASIYGMNVIVNDETHYWSLAIVLAVMLTISGLLLRWGRRQGWW